MIKMATVTVKINGLEYNLKGRENEEYLKQVADYVESKVQELVSKNNKLTAPAASALTAINIADELFKGNKEYNDLLDEYETIQKENKALRLEASTIKEELSTIKEELNEIKIEKAKFESKDIEKLDSEILTLKEDLDKRRRELSELTVENNNLKNENRDIKFSLQSSKYRVMDLEKKFLDSQIAIAKEKKNKNVLLKAGKAL